jgi:SAM-dependent methyltransferase
MEKPVKSLDAEFFEKLYQENEDPWNFENSAYEKEKYRATLLAIPNDMYQNIFEIGCSNGVLSMMIVNRCQRLLAVDASVIAVNNAAKRLAKYPHAEVKTMTIPDDFPNEKFDLILFSEVGYFLNEEDLVTARDKMIASLLPHGHLILVHWRPVVAEFPLTGDEVHEIFSEKSGNTDQSPLSHLIGESSKEYRLDVFEKKE